MNLQLRPYTSPKQRAARSHNYLMRQNCILRQIARSVVDAPTTNRTCKEIGIEIVLLSERLDEELRKERIDP